MNKPFVGPAILCLAVALMAGAASGIFLRGEAYEYAATGIYKYNAQRIVAEGVGWDIVTPFLVVPAMLAVLPSLGLGSLRGRLIALGLLAYFFYQYLEYAVFWAFGPLFPLFVAIYAGSIAGIVWILSSLDIRSLAGRFSGDFPRRGMAMLSGLNGRIDIRLSGC